MHQKSKYIDEKSAQLSKIFEGIKPNSPQDVGITERLRSGNFRTGNTLLDKKALEVKAFYDTALDEQNATRTARGQTEMLRSIVGWVCISDQPWSDTIHRMKQRIDWRQPSILYILHLYDLFTIN